MALRLLLELCAAAGDDESIASSARAMVAQNPALVFQSNEDERFMVGGRLVSKGATALIAAAVGGNSVLTETILDAGANPLLQIDIHQQNPLMWASRYNHVHVITLLLDRFPQLLSTTDLIGWTALFQSAFYDRIEATLHLIASGMDLHAIGIDKKTTPLGVYGAGVRLKYTDRFDKVKTIEKAFAQGPHPSQVQRRKTEIWIRRWPFIQVMVQCGFQPLLHRRVEQLLNSPPVSPDDEIPPVELVTAEQRRAFYLMQIFGHEGFWKAVAAYL